MKTTTAKFFLWVQRYLRNEVNAHLRQVEPVVNTVVERQSAQERGMEEVITYITS